MTNLKQLKEALAIQGESGNWNYDSYMHGMYNGMEYAVSLLEGRDPDYREAPSVWLADQEIPEMFIHTVREKM